MSTDIATIVLKADSQGIISGTVALDRMADAAGRTEGATSRLTSVVKTLASGYAAFKVVEYAKEATLLNARYETLGVSLYQIGRTAGYSAAQMNAVTKSLEDTGISMVESRQQIIKLVQAHISLNQATKLARIAQDAAVVGNMNSSDAFAHMIHGIQTGQTEILRTIGLNVSMERSYQEYAKTLHKTQQQLTQTERMQAIVNAVMREGASIAGIYEAAMGTAGKQLLTMQRYTQNLKLTVGEVFNDALVIAVEAATVQLKYMNKEARELAEQDQLREWGRDVIRMMAQLADIVHFVGGAFVEAGKDVLLFGRIADLAAKMTNPIYAATHAKELVQEYKDLKVSVNEVSASHDKWSANVGRFGAAAEARIAILQKEQGATRELTKILAGYEKARESMGKNVPDVIKNDALQRIIALKMKDPSAMSNAEYINAIKDVQGRTAATLPSDTTSDKKGTDKVKSFMESLKKEAETLGMTEAQSKLYEAALLKIHGTNLLLVKSQVAKIESFKLEKETREAMVEDFLAQQEKADGWTKSTYDATKTAEENNVRMEYEIGLVGRTTEERERLMATYDIEVKYKERIKELNATGFDQDSKWYQAQLAWLNELKTKQLAGVESSAILKAHQKQADQLTKIWDNFAQNVQRAMGDQFYNILQGKFDDVAGAFKSMIDRMIADAMAAQLNKYLFGIGGPMSPNGVAGGFFNNLLGGAGASFGAGAASSVAMGSLGTNLFSEQSLMLAAQVFHRGGTIGQGDQSRSVDARVFRDAPRLHQGGLLPGEVPVIAQAGERVLTAKQQKKAGGTVVHMTINTPDANSFRQSEGQITAQASRMLARAKRNS